MFCSTDIFQYKPVGFLFYIYIYVNVTYGFIQSDLHSIPNTFHQFMYSLAVEYLTLALLTCYAV